MEEDFVQAQSSFLFSKCEVFENTEENKLEYTDIYHSYLHIMETIIEVQLKERCGFVQEEIDSFYLVLQNDKSNGVVK